MGCSLWAHKESDTTEQLGHPQYPGFILDEHLIWVGVRVHNCRWEVINDGLLRSGQWILHLLHSITLFCVFQRGQLTLSCVLTQKLTWVEMTRWGLSHREVDF